MAKPYSDDLRERAVAAIESGHTREEVAELYNLALSTVGGFIRRWHACRPTPRARARARRVVPISELVFGALTQNRSSLEDAPPCAVAIELRVGARFRHYPLGGALPNGY